jgi:hypothetical protein
MLSRDPSLTPAQVQQVLQQTADKIDGGAAMYDGAGFSLTHGYGRVNACRALGGSTAFCAGAAGEGEVEFGVRLGVTVLDGVTTRRMANAPGGGPYGRPALYGAMLLPPSWMLELQVGFDRESETGLPTRTETVGAFQLAYRFGNFYAGPGVAVRSLTIGSTSTTGGATGFAVGIRWLPRPFLALRLEGRYRYWPSPNLHESGLALAFGVVM